MSGAWPKTFTSIQVRHKPLGLASGMDIEVSDSTVNVLAAYTAVRPTADAQTKIVLRAHVDALLKGGWTSAEIIPLVEAFAELGLDPFRVRMVGNASTSGQNMVARGLMMM